MNDFSLRKLSAALIAACTLVLATASTMAATPAEKPSAQKPASRGMPEAHKTIRNEMAYCASGQSPQGRQVCEQEARAAHAQNLRGALADDTSTSYTQNAEQRCQALPPAERGVCMRRVDGKIPPDAVQVVPGSEAPLQSTTPLRP